MIEFGLLIVAVLAFLWMRDRVKQAELVKLDRAGTMINAVLADLAAMNEAKREEAQQRFAEAIKALASQFPGDESTLAVLHRYAYNSSDQKLRDATAVGDGAHAVALYRPPELVVLTAIGAVALAELNVRKYKSSTRYRDAAERISRSVRDHFVIASSRTAGDVINNLGLENYTKYTNKN